MKLIFTVFISYCLVSCFSPKKMMDGWIGKTRRDLLLQMGPPDRTASDGANGEILVFISHNYSQPAHTAAVPIIDTIHKPNLVIATHQPLQGWQTQTMYFINPEGKIYHWLIKTDDLPPGQVGLNVYKR